MSKKNNNALFYTCSLIEYVGRANLLERSTVVKLFGADIIRRIYNYSDVFHSEPIKKVADEFIAESNLKHGSFDSEAECVFTVPDYWTIGQVYERLIEDVSGEDNILEKLMEVYTSWIDEYLSNYNIAVYYQSREYIAQCYKSGNIL